MPYIFKSTNNLKKSTNNLKTLIVNSKEYYVTNHVESKLEKFLLYLIQPIIFHTSPSKNKYPPVPFRPLFCHL